MKHIDAKNLNFRYALVQAFFWLNFVAISGYSSVFLLDCGLTNSQIGLVVGIAGILAAIIQPVIAGYADKPRAMSLKWIVSIISILAIIITVVMLLMYGRSIAIIGILYCGCVMFLQILTPFISSLGSEMQQQGCRLNFGLSRAAGSLSFAILSFFMGNIAAMAGIISVPIVILLGYCALLISVLVYPFRKKRILQDDGNTSDSVCKKNDAVCASHETKIVSDDSRSGVSSKAGGSSASPIVFFRKHPKFGVLLIGVTFAYISHALLNTYLYQIVVSKGGGSVELGRVMALCALVEMVPMLIFALMLKKFESNVWMCVCGVALTLKALGTLLVGGIPGLYAVSLLQMLGWGLIAVAPIYYVNRVIDPEDAIKGQAYMGMTYTLGCVISSVIGGVLLDTAGVQGMLIFSVSCGVIATFLICLFTERLKKES